jgi:hypothetical protein
MPLPRYTVKERVSALKQMSDRMAALERDKTILDWLEANTDYIVSRYHDVIFSTTTDYSVRDAIAALMATPKSRKKK